MKNASGGGVDSLWSAAQEGVCGGQALNRTEYLDLTQVDAVRSAIAVAYALVAVLGVCGNAALISIILSRRYLHTASNWSLLSSTPIFYLLLHTSQWSSSASAFTLISGFTGSEFNARMRCAGCC